MFNLLISVCLGVNYFLLANLILQIYNEYRELSCPIVIPN